MDCKDEKCPHNEDELCKNTESVYIEEASSKDSGTHYEDEYSMIFTLMKRCGRLSKKETDPTTTSGIEQMHQVYRQNTEKLLRSYRRYIWELNSACNECAAELNLPLEKVTEYLKDVDVDENAAARHVVYRNKSLATSKTMVDYLNMCLTRLKTMPAIKSSGSRKSVSGEILYRVIEITYLFPGIGEQVNREIPLKKQNDFFYNVPSDARDDILCEYGGSRRAYYAHRKTAIEELSLIMWGGTSPLITTLSDILSRVDI